MRSRRSVTAVLVVLVALAVGVAWIAGRDRDANSEGLRLGVLPMPKAAELLCGSRFAFRGTAYQIRSTTPFPPGRELGTVQVQSCLAPSRRVRVTVHAFSDVDPGVALGVRNGMTVLALAPSKCLGLRDARLIECLRSTA